MNESRYESRTLGGMLAAFLDGGTGLEQPWAERLVRDAHATLARRFPELSEYRIHVIVDGQLSRNAATAAGAHIFIGHRLLELCANVERTAFVLAHEIAHHACGHIRPTPSWIVRTGSPTLAFLWQAWCNIGMLGRGHARLESEADACAIDMCIAAGLNAEKCLEALQVLEKLTLDRGGCAYGDEAFYASGMDERERTRRIRRHTSWALYYPVRVRRRLAEYHAGLITELDVYLH